MLELIDLLEVRIDLLKGREKTKRLIWFNFGLHLGAKRFTSGLPSLYFCYRGFTLEPGAADLVKICRIRRRENSTESGLNKGVGTIPSIERGCRLE